MIVNSPPQKMIEDEHATGVPKHFNHFILNTDGDVHTQYECIIHIQTSTHTHTLYLKIHMNIQMFNSTLTVLWGAAK